MNPPKPPSDTAPPSKPDGADKSSGNSLPTTGPHPLSPDITGRTDGYNAPEEPLPDSNRPKSFLVANTPGGLLAQRDPEQLRRYVLNANDEAEQERRQRELLALGSQTLSFWPTEASDLSPGRNGQRANTRVTHIRLWAWPVLVSHANVINVASAFSLGPGGPGSLACEVTRAWAAALDVSSTELRVEGAVSVERLTALSPLKLQSIMSHESRRLASAEQTGSTPARGAPGVSGAQWEAPWSLALVPLDNSVTQFVPDRPLVFILTAFVAGNSTSSHPLCQSQLQDAKARMVELMSALFTAGQRTPIASGNTGGHQSQSVIFEKQTERTSVVPAIRMGQPQTFYEAVTQGQWMQLAWMAERARKTGRQFRLSQQQQGSLLTWEAHIGHDSEETDEDGPLLRHTYDGFWRPVGHVQVIQRCIDQAQGSGKMPVEDIFSSQHH